MERSLLFAKSVLHGAAAAAAVLFGAGACQVFGGEAVREAGVGSGVRSGSEGDQRLPTAFVEEPYRFELEPSRREAASRFVIAAGALPEGLTLSEGGVIEGTARAQGARRFSIDEDAGAGKTRRTFDLRVSRKRWVAYRSDDRAGGQPLLYLADLGGDELKKTLLTGDVQARAEVLPGHYRFAPSDEALAYLVDATSDGVRELYAVDLSDGAGAPPVRLDHGAHVRSFAWSPDARGVAYVAEDGGGLVAFVVEWPFDGSRASLGAAGGQGRVSWVHPGLLVLEAPRGGSAIVRSREGRFEVASAVAATGVVMQADGERATLGEELSQCVGALYQVDFRDLPVAEAPRSAAGEARSFGRAAVVEHDVLSVVSASEELARVPLGACDSVSWAADGDTLLSLDEERRVRLTTVSRERATHQLVPGEYGPVLPWPRPVLDARGAWLKFHDAEQAYLSRVSAGRPGPALSVREMVALGEVTVRDSAFLPGGQVLLVVSDARGESTLRLDLGREPSTARVVFRAAVQGGKSLGLSGGLSDGSWMGLYVRDSRAALHRGRVDLWLAPSTPNASARAPAGRYVGEVLRGVRDALFQP